MLRNSFLLDLVVTVHIYNNIARFTHVRPVTEYILAGDNIMPIEVYGTVIMNDITPSRPT